MRRPYWREQTQHYYVKVNGKPVRLSRQRHPDGDKRKTLPIEVENEWHRVTREGIPTETRLSDVFTRFKATCESAHHAKSTNYMLDQFQAFVGPDMKAENSAPSTCPTSSRPRPPGTRRANAPPSTASSPPSITPSGKASDEEPHQHCTRLQAARPLRPQERRRRPGAARGTGGRRPPRLPGLPDRHAGNRVPPPNSLCPHRALLPRPGDFIRPQQDGQRKPGRPNAPST